MKSEMVTIPKAEYEELKMKAEIDTEFLKQLIESLKDIKYKRLKRIK